MENDRFCCSRRMIGAMLMAILGGVGGTMVTQAGEAKAPATALAIGAQAGQLPKANAEKLLGREGWLMIRSQARMDQVQEQFRALGLEAMDDRVGPLRAVDYSKSMVLGYYAFGDIGDKYTAGKCDGDAARINLSLLRNYTVSFKRPADGAEKKCSYVLVVIPRTKEIQVTIARWTQNGGPEGAPDKAVVELTRVLATDGGDMVDGLRGSIRAEKKEVAARDDIRFEFTLSWDDPHAGRERAAAPAPKPVFVWDGKFSEGYRNCAFHVETPEGKSQAWLRAAEHEWRRNMPYPVEIKDGRPYVLPGSEHVDNWISLKELGLDTTKPGTYRITGIYMEQAIETDGMAGRKADGTKYMMWGGNIATNTVEVEVK